MLSDIIAHFTEGNKSKFAAMLGVTPQAINTWEKRNTFDIELIFAKCEGISALWLLTGEGSMLAKDHAEKKSCGDPIIDRLLAMIDEKDAVIREQAEELGQLRERLTRQGGNADAADNTPAARAV